jgi:hypothetical protein
MRFVRFFILVSCLSLGVVTLVGCGSKSDETPKTQSSQAVPTPPPVTIPGNLGRMLGALPDNVRFLLAVDDIDKLRTALRSTPAGRVFEEPEIQKWRMAGWPKLKRAVSQRWRFSFEDAERRLHGGMVLGIVASPDPSRPVFFLMIRPSGDVSVQEKEVRSFFERGVFDLAVEREGETIVVAPAYCTKDIADMRKRLTQFLPTSGRIAREMDPSASVHLWVDLAAGREDLRHGMTDEERASYDRIESAYGFGNLDAWYAGIGVRDGAIRVSARLRARGALQGLPALVGENSKSAAEIVPAGQDFFLSLRVNSVSDILTFLRAGSAALSDTNDSSTVDRDMQTLGNITGDPEFEKNLSRAIGNECALSIRQSTPVDVQIAAWIAVRDYAIVDRWIGAYLSGKGLTPQTETLGKRSFSCVPLTNNPFAKEICYGNVGDFLVVTRNREAYRAILLNTDTTDTLASSKEYREAMGKTPTDDAGFLTVYGRVPPAAQPLIAASIAASLPAVRQVWGIPIDSAMLPDFLALQRLDGPSMLIGTKATDSIALEANVRINPLLPLLRFVTALAQYEEAHTRIQCATVQKDMQRLGEALRAFSMDRKSYPLPAEGVKGINAAAGPGEPVFAYPTFDGTLTTPLAYITSQPTDPFAPVPGSGYLYHSRGKGWMLMSAGPDGDYDVPSAFFHQSDAPSSVTLLLSAYDPTNGMKSSGDILRFSR